MIKLLIKELILIATVWSIGVVSNFIMGGSIVLFWTIYCFLLLLLFLSGSLLLKIWIKKHPELAGFVFAGFSFINQIIFLSILFIFLKPQEPDHRMMAIAGLTGYLICFFFDTYWKLNWINDSKN